MLGGIKVQDFFGDAISSNNSRLQLHTLPGQQESSIDLRLLTEDRVVFRIPIIECRPGSL
jgi:hypothetical protein